MLCLWAGSQVSTRNKGDRAEDFAPLENNLLGRRYNTYHLLLLWRSNFLLWCFQNLFRKLVKVEIAKELNLFFDILRNYRNNIFDFTTPRLIRLHSIAPRQNFEYMQVNVGTYIYIGCWNRGLFLQRFRYSRKSFREIVIKCSLTHFVKEVHLATWCFPPSCKWDRFISYIWRREFRVVG